MSKELSHPVAGLRVVWFKCQTPTQVRRGQAPIHSNAEFLLLGVLKTGSASEHASHPPDCSEIRV